MASGMARGARDRGKRIAFGDGKQILWDHQSEQVFRKNPNVAFPGCERDGDLEWITFYRGNRIYNTQAHNRWIWNYDFKAVPGEVFLTPEELQFGRWVGRGYVVIEPNVPEHKTVAPNKQWPRHRYQEVAKQLLERGYDVVQMTGRHQLTGVRQVKTQNFRLALSVLKNAALYIGPEGGLHHGAAAVGVPAVVLFGGFIPPSVTGYDSHTNLTGGAVACGSLQRCDHCFNAMHKITVADVLIPAMNFLKKAA